MRRWWWRWQRDVLLGLVRSLVGGRAAHEVTLPSGCIVFANHTSHLDALVLLAAVPAPQRDRFRPVAGADYWGRGALRRYVAQRLLNAVLIDRVTGGPQALQPVLDALDAGDSVIVFPEGTRGQGCVPQPFKAGLFHLAVERPGTALVPAYLENMHRSWPKGAPMPLPLLCRVRFGLQTARLAHEEKPAFLLRMRTSVTLLSEA